MGWKHFQTVDNPKREPQVGTGLFGIRVNCDARTTCTNSSGMKLDLGLDQDQQ